jgi:hypothetical protein
MGEHRALLVANAKYREESSLPDLMAPVYDATRMRDALTDTNSGLFARGNVRMLADARCADILASMEDFFQTADRSDTLLLYYSGHGTTNINNNFFLCAADTKLDRLVSTAVRDQAVNEMMLSSPASTFVVILDCCSSGSWKSATELPPALRGDGRFVLSSSRPGQNSSDANVLTESSPFTKLLVEALETADLDTDRDGFVQIDDVYRHIDQRLQGQRAQRDYGKSTATVALARRPAPGLSDDRTAGGNKAQRVAVGRSTSVSGHTAVTNVYVPTVGAAEPPSLAVSPEEISNLDAEVGDLPLIERVYVFNRGGGDLSWTAESDHDWIAMEVHPEYLRLTIAPERPGVHRGAIYVRPRGPGRVARVPVVIKVSPGANPQELQPRLTNDEFVPASDNSATSKSTPRRKSRRRTNRERLEDELKRLDFELDPWSPNIWYSDDYAKGHKKPRVAIRPPRIRIEALDAATGTWQLLRSFSLEEELEAAFTEIAAVRRTRRGPTHTASRDAARKSNPADERLRQVRETAIPTAAKPTEDWRVRMSEKLIARGFIQVKPDEWLDPFGMSIGAPTRVTWTESTMTIEGMWATRNQTIESFEMGRQFDQALAAIDGLAIRRRTKPR